MPVNSNFLADLSSGIFGRMGELRNEQTSRDEKRRGETLNLLAGLADKVEPESLPLLMQHIGDTMKLQGPMKKFWQAFSGMPDRGLEDQLGTKLKGILDTAVGPDKARNVRTGGDLARLFQPQTPEQESNRASRLSAESDLSNRLVFRDPQQDAIEKLKAQYGLQYQNKLNELATREEFMRERQRLNDERDFANRWEMAQMTSTLKARQGIFTEAMKVAQLSGRKYPTDTDYDRAIANISRRDNLNEEVLRERAGYLRAKGEEAKRTIAAGGLKPSDVDRRFKMFSTEKDKYSKEMSNRAKAQTERDKILSDINTIMGTGAFGFTYKYNPDAPPDQRVQIVSTPPGASEAMAKSGAGFVLNRVMKAGLLDKLTGAQGRYAQSDEGSQRYFKNLLAPEYREYFSATDEQLKGLRYTDDIEQFMRRGKAPSKPTAPSRSAPSKTVSPPTPRKVTIPIMPGDTNQYQEGDSVTWGDKKYRVKKVLNRKLGKYLEAIPE